MTQGDAGEAQGDADGELELAISAGAAIEALPSMKMCTGRLSFGAELAHEELVEVGVDVQSRKRSSSPGS
jgi:hypothetical protein